MINCIDLTIPVAEVLKEHPELKPLLIDLGFKPLANPMMLNTVAKVTSISAGSKLSGISIAAVKETLLCNGYEIKE